jgi:hypothetical protein
MRLLIVTDAWSPQVNGVVRTLQAVRDELERMGHQVATVSPDQFTSVPCPTYPEIRLALATGRAVGSRIEAAAPQALHIATEGPLGLAARRWCLRSGFPFTTAYHTQFPEYVSKRTHLPAELFWRYIRWFHAPAEAVLVSTPSIERSLHEHGLTRTRQWGRGVDLRLFRPDAAPLASLAALPRPLMLCVGRVAVEKNIEPSFPRATPAARSWSARDRRRPSSRRASPMRTFSARSTAMLWPGLMPRPTCSSSRAAPIRSACHDRSAGMRHPGGRLSRAWPDRRAPPGRRLHGP